METVLKELKKQELENIFGEEEELILKYFIYKNLLSQPEVLPSQTELPIHIPKEHIEQWVVQALGVEPTGAGSYPIDVYSPKEKWGADVKMISAKTDKAGNLKKDTESGETSLAQKFKDTGKSLDTLFASEQYELIKTQWLRIFKEKYEKVKEEKDIEKIYYFFMIRAGLVFYLVGLRLELGNLSNVVVDNTSKRKEAVVLKNFIDAQLGTARIYKAKKRLELRLYPAEWESRGNYIKFSCSFNIDKVKLKNQIIDEESLRERFLDLANEIILTKIIVE
ncbi:MAG: hypothetical protein ACOX6Q_02695 [Candidatus Dojkabacteria bacterium]|jgi:hypothetical protein